MTSDAPGVAGLEKIDEVLLVYLDEELKDGCAEFEVEACSDLEGPVNVLL